jgi:organic hydroperoxide reductase OsmC/OhrA
MSEHLATIRWQRGDADFIAGKYSRVHSWAFDGGARVEASASPSVVPSPYSSRAAIDPEEALVAAIASCHMAQKQGFQVDSYEDAAVGAMTKGANGVPWVSSVTLRPAIVYGGGKKPTADEAQNLHHTAHEPLEGRHSPLFRATYASEGSLLHGSLPALSA